MRTRVVEPGQEERSVGALAGCELLGVVTVGMYDNPLELYREYIQNSTDAVYSRERNRGNVTISLDTRELSCSVRDDGPGLTHTAAVRELVPVGRSQKRRGTDLGFRGVGRLAGLAFADAVTFRTRAGEEQPVTVITWRGTAVRNYLGSTKDVGHVVRQSVDVSEVSGETYPAHFFEVKLQGIHRHAAGTLLNRGLVRKYVSEVCPVPFSSDWPFHTQAASVLAEAGDVLTLEIKLDGDMEPIVRPFGGAIRLSAKRNTRYRYFERLQIPSIDRQDMAAVGWIAHTEYTGAIPQAAAVRGIRARAGNVQIGNDLIFDRLFAETRFNRWCVGEIYIRDGRIVPNGRRDYFEPGPHTRNLENHLSVAFRRLTSRIRLKSKARNRGRKLAATVDDLEATLALAVSGYLSGSVAKALVDRALANVERTREAIFEIYGRDQALDRRLDQVVSALESFQPRRGRPTLRGIPPSEVGVYRRVFGRIVEVSRSPKEAVEQIEAILALGDG